MKLYLGGDASKGYSDWVIITEKKRVVLEDAQLDDTYGGHCQLFSILKTEQVSTLLKESEAT